MLGELTHNSDMRYVMTFVGGPADGVMLPTSANRLYWIADYELGEDGYPMPTPTPPVGSAIYEADKVRYVMEFKGYTQ